MIVNLQKVFYNSNQASVDDRQFTIILFISIIFLPTILNYLNDREGAPLSFVGFWRPNAPPPSPDATILNYLNDIEEGHHYFCRILAPPPPQCPPPNTAILNYFNDREREGGAIIICRILAPPTHATIDLLNYLNDRKEGGTTIFCKILSPPFTRRHNT